MNGKMLSISRSRIRGRYSPKRGVSKLSECQNLSSNRLLDAHWALKHGVLIFVGTLRFGNLYIYQVRVTLRVMIWLAA